MGDDNLAGTGFLINDKFQLEDNGANMCKTMAANLKI